MVQRKALSVTSYVGCGISLVCLTAAIVLFLIYRLVVNNITCIFSLRSYLAKQYLNSDM